MYDVSTTLPFYLFLSYLAISAIVLALCLLTLVAVYRTKRVPYPTKLLSMGLIAYDCLFIGTAIGGKFVTFEESVTFRFFTRGFQFAAQVIVMFMAIERYFVLNWPYIYMRLGTKRRTRKLCIAIIVVSLLQYLLIRLLLCNARGKTTSCSVQLGIYFALSLIICFAISIAAYAKIFAVIFKSPTKTASLREYKGTRASFLFLLNSTVTLGTYIAIAIYLAVSVSTDDKEQQALVSNLTDFVYVLTCIFDALVYAIWFKEVQMQIVKIFSYICPRLEPVAEEMRIQAFSIELTVCKNVKSDNCDANIAEQ